LDYCRIQQSKLPRHIHHNGKRVVPIGNAHTYAYWNTERNSYSYAHTHSNTHCYTSSCG
jgi:hypothetical protein